MAAGSTTAGIQVRAVQCSAVHCSAVWAMQGQATSLDSQKHIDFSLKSAFGGVRPCRIKKKNAVSPSLSFVKPEYFGG
jgi:hypothetical protein